MTRRQWKLLAAASCLFTADTCRAERPDEVMHRINDEDSTVSKGIDMLSHSHGRMDRQNSHNQNEPLNADTGSHQTLDAKEDKVEPQTPHQEVDEADETTHDNDGDTEGSSDVRDDDRIQSSAPAEHERVRRDPRPVSEQVKAYYEYIAAGSNRVNGTTGGDTENHIQEVPLESVDVVEGDSETNEGDGETTIDEVSDAERELKSSPVETEEARMCDAGVESVDSVVSEEEGASAESDSGVEPTVTRTPIRGDSNENIDNCDSPEAGVKSESDEVIQNEPLIDGESKKMPLKGGELDEPEKVETSASKHVNETYEAINKDVLTRNTTADNETMRSISDSLNDEPIMNQTDHAEPSNVQMMENVTLSNTTTPPESESGSHGRVDKTKTSSENEADSESAKATNGSAKSESRSNVPKTEEDTIDFDLLDNVADDVEETISEELNIEWSSDEDSPSNNEAIPQESKSQTAMQVDIDDNLIDFDVIDCQQDESFRRIQDDASRYTGSKTDFSSRKSADELGATGTGDNDEEQEALIEKLVEATPKKTHESESIDGEATLLRSSTAELFHKVSQKESIDLGDGTVRVAKIANDESIETVDSAEKVQPVLEASIKESVPTDENVSNDATHQAGGWGVRTQSVPRTSTNLPEYLTRPITARSTRQIVSDVEPQQYDMRLEADSLSDDNIAENVSDDATGTENEGASSDTTKAGNIDSNTSSSSNDAVVDDKSILTESKSVNSEFVDGLDDLDKFFQSVDPPDELDVGAAGTSIQDVLVGQSVQIVLKRLKLGLKISLDFVRRRFAKVKIKVDEYVSRRTTKDGEFALITREDVKTTVDSVKRLFKQAINGAKSIVDDLFADDDSGDDIFGFDDGMDQMRAKLDSLRREQQPIPRRKAPA